MKISKKQYKKMVDKASPPTNSLKNCIMAFLNGGLLCAFGELLRNFYLSFLPKEESATAVSSSLVVFSAILTVLHLYEKWGAIAGAGTIVPITGFANSVVSPAIEFKREGYVLGVGAKMFIMAGPVIVYGTVASIIYGLIYYIVALIR